MRYRVLASDYDGTLAQGGYVAPRTVAALERFVESGRKLVLVTGRELDELLELFDGTTLFERVVAENGAVLYRPSDEQGQLLAEPPPEAFVQVLRDRGVQPLAVGKAIVATCEPYEVTVLGAIRDLGLELQVIFNKGSVMVLPAGVTKATGLKAALRELGLSPHNAVAVGDAENDHALLAICECSAAVANALPALQERADIVTRGDHGDGVIELIERIIADDLVDMAPRLTRHYLPMGQRRNGEEFRLAPYGGNFLLACPPTRGLPGAVANFLHRLGEAGYQYCLIDREGASPATEQVVVLGTVASAPTGDEVVQALSSPKQNAVVVLAGLPPEAWPEFTRMLLRRLQQMRAATSRPHWIIVNQAHDLLPREDWDARADGLLPRQGMLLVSSDPSALAPAPLAGVGMAIVAGASALAALDGQPAGGCDGLFEGLRPEEMIVWQRDAGEPPFPMRIVDGRRPSPNHVSKGVP